MKKNNKELLSVLNETKINTSKYSFVVIARDKTLKDIRKLQDKDTSNIYTYLLTRDYLQAEKSKEIMREDGFRNINIYNLLTDDVPIRKGLIYLRFIEEAYWSDNYKKKRFRLKKRKGVEF